MSFAIGARSQSIYQPLELAKLPNAELKTLNFDNYQQKQEQELRVDPAVEARQLRKQRADAQGAITDYSTELEGTQNVSSSPSIDTLQSLFQRQQFMASIAAGEHTALQAGQSTGLSSILGTATPQNPAGAAPGLERLVKSGPSGGQQDIETMMAARYPDTHGNSTPTDPATEAAKAKAAAEDKRQQAVEDAALERKQNSEEIAKFADDIRSGKTLAAEKEEDDSATAGTAQVEQNETVASQSARQIDAYRAAIEQAAAKHQSLSERSNPQQSNTTLSALAQQIRTDNFISDIQNMQGMQFGTANGSQLSAAA